MVLVHRGHLVLLLSGPIAISTILVLDELGSRELFIPLLMITPVHSTPVHSDYSNNKGVSSHFCLLLLQFTLFTHGLINFGTNN